MSWLADWGYRKKITINGSSGAGTNYQVLLKVGESSGASGCDFHVEGHSANFPSDKNQSGDLRFTDNDGITLLSFWVEKVEGTSPNRVAHCWVKVTDNLDSSVDIYCYYGNSEAGNVSDVSNTFIRVIDGNQPLKGSWHFDEGSGTTAYDRSGNGNDGTLINSPTWVDGKFGKALNFNGSNNYVDLGDDSINSAGIITFECWFKSNNIASAQGTSSIVNTGYDYNTGKNYLVVGLYNSKILATAAGTPDSSRTSDNLQSNTWYHLVVIKVSKDISKIYINGVDDTHGASTNWGGDVSSVIGKIDIATDQYFNGIIDEVRIYNKALAADEISDLYNNYGYTTTSYPGRVLVRKRTDPEPSFSSIGSEERPSFALTDIVLKGINLKKEHLTSSAIVSLNVTSSCVVDVRIRSAFFISGHVTLAKNPVEGAVVRCICQDDNSLVGTTTTDANGYYKFTGVSDTKRYHISVEYEDAEGNKYHSFSYPYIIPVSLS